MVSLVPRPNSEARVSVRSRTKAGVTMKDEWRAAAASAAVTAGLLFLWFRIEHWVVWRSAYTDLPGQDTLQLVNGVQPYALGLVALVAGWVSGFFSRSRRWFAAFLGISPLLLLIAVSPRQFWFWYVLGPVLAFVGAYAPTWMATRRTTTHGEGTSSRQAGGAGPGF